MRAGALDLAEREIRVNAVIAIRPRDERAETYTATRTPLRRGAQGDEIADAVRYLASPEAAIVTGATLVLDGGRQRLSGILD
jgi:NAD(P)-dependent dehydrogenase (short-subunit alcohol dehydrogenase family)